MPAVGHCELETAVWWGWKSDALAPTNVELQLTTTTPEVVVVE